MVTENNQSDEKYEPCFHERKIEFIKNDILAQIYKAGIRQGFDISDCVDEHGELDEVSQVEFSDRTAAILEVYRDIIETVWNDDFDGYVCDECQQKLEDAETVDKLDEELKKNNPK